MDTSNSLGISRIDYLIRGYEHHIVPDYEVPPGEWVAFVNAALQRIRPRLKYMPGFCELRQIDFEVKTVLLDDRVIQAAEGLGLSGRTLVRFMTSSERPRSPFSDDIYVEDIYLTRTGQWIHAGYKLEQEVRSDWFCQVLTPESLLKLVQNSFQYPQLGGRLFIALHRMVQESVTEREQTLRALRAIEGDLAQMRSRVSL